MGSSPTIVASRPASSELHPRCEVRAHGGGSGFAHAGRGQQLFERCLAAPLQAAEVAQERPLANRADPLTVPQRLYVRSLARYPLYMQSFTAVIERDEATGLFVGYVPGWPGAHSQGATLDELRQNLEKVIAMLLEDGAPKLEGEFVGTQTVKVA